MGWDSSQNFHPIMGWNISKKIFVPWDGTDLKISVPSWDGILFKNFSSHGMGWDGIIPSHAEP
jgi:hypothetical protein